jgi:alpha,alpha-trehalase
LRFGARAGSAARYHPGTMTRAVLLALTLSACAPHPRPATPAAGGDPLRAYVKRAWATLTRSLADLPAAAPDPKVEHAAGSKWTVWVPASTDPARLAASLPPAGRAAVELRRLPPPPALPDPAGLLYLPRPYVVPGGRFNEMYGWDSYFILRGLLRDGETWRARDMVENFLYEVEHYGTVLNANRTYYLTRSQPPFLGRMVLETFERTRDRDLLVRARPLLERHHAYWTTGEHQAGETGLSRYWDFGEGPAPEVVAGERDAQGRTHYDRVREAYRRGEVKDAEPELFYDVGRDALTPLFYKGDRSMRESGFDPSGRFGHFGAGVVHLAPVCLNTLLVVMEQDLASVAAELGDEPGAQAWRAKAAERAKRMDALLWDEETGLYLDWDFRRSHRRVYPFATTFWPLWAGIASPERAARVRSSLARLEAPGGLLTSPHESGSQWDAPYGWAPLQVLAIGGLRRYGYGDDADRLARKFVDTVRKEHAEHGVVVEKYDLRRRESDLGAGLRFGYTSNEVGFGWTNAAVVELLEDLAAR